MRQLDNTPSSEIEAVETCFPLENEGRHHRTGNPGTMIDSLINTLNDFEVPESAWPDIDEELDDDDDWERLRELAYEVCEIVLEHTKRADLKDCLVWFDEDEPALYFYQE